MSRIHILNANDRFPVGFFIEGNHHEGERWATATGKHRDTGASHPLDLLLPAIEEERAAAAPFLEPAIASLKAVRDAWDDFQKGVAADKLDPAMGGVCICGKMGLSIQCNYSGPSDAFDDAGRVIAAINSLLEGGAR